MIKKKNVWFDIDNLPHIPVLMPIINILESNGYGILITVKDHAFACERLDSLNVEYKRIGRHYGKNPIMKITGTLFRSLQLFIFSIKHRHIVLSVSHWSRSLIIASFLRRIKSIGMFDYEHVNTNIFLAMVHQVYVPEIIKKNIFSANIKIFPYSGFKEELYTWQNNIGTLKSINHVDIDLKKIVIVLRPPASLAHYHNSISENLFNCLIRKFSENYNVFVIIVPRVIGDIKKYSDLPSDIFHCLEKPVDGLSLINTADYVFSGGGTMVREAAVMGVSSYSFFQGKESLLDTELINQGKLNKLSTEEDVLNLSLVKKEKNTGFKKKSGLIDVINYIKPIINNDQIEL